MSAQYLSTRTHRVIHLISLHLINWLECNQITHIQLNKFDFGHCLMWFPIFTIFFVVAFIHAMDRIIFMPIHHDVRVVYTIPVLLFEKHENQKKNNRKCEPQCNQMMLLRMNRGMKSGDVLL